MTAGGAVGPRAAAALTVCGLAAYGLARRFLLPGEWHLAANVAAAAAVAGLAAAAGLRAEELGLSRSTWRAGARLGGLALAAIGGGVLVVAALPVTRELLVTDGLDPDALAAARTALIVIPLGTVLVEELAFRGVLLALLRRVTTPTAAVAGSVLAFSVWHLPPLLGGGTDGAAGADVAGSPGLVIATTLVATALAGLGFTWLRLRADSLVAPALAHLATNSVTFAAAWWVSTR